MRANLDGRRPPIDLPDTYEEIPDSLSIRRWRRNIWLGVILFSAVFWVLFYLFLKLVFSW